MPTKNEVLAEAKKRGLLSERESGIAQEAASRGLLGDMEEDISSGTGGFLGTMLSEQEPPDRDNKQFASDIYTPVLEGGGLALGATLGTGATPGVGTVAGGGLGFAIGSNIADRLDEFLGLEETASLMGSTTKAGKDIVSGAAYEAGGQGIVKGVVVGGKLSVAAAEKMGLMGFFKRIKKLFPSLSDKGIALKAKDILEEIRSDEAALLGKTIKESEGVVSRLGVKEPLTFAQKSGSVKSGSFEQSMTAKHAELKEILLTKDAKIRQEALEGLEKKFLGIPGEIDDAVSGVTKQHQKLKDTVGKAKGIVEKDVAKVGASKRIQEIGEGIQTELNTAKLAEKSRVSKLYDDIPQNTQLKGYILKRKMIDTISDFKKRGGGRKTFPVDIVKQMKSVFKGSKDGKISFERLRDFRSQIGEETREALMGQTPNLKLVRRLNMLKEGVDDSLNQMLAPSIYGLSGKQAQAAALKYKKATLAYAKYSATFKPKAVGSVLEKGTQASGYKVGYSDVPARFFGKNKMDAADELINAYGKPKAAIAIDEYASLDLYSKAVRSGKFNKKATELWVKSNEDVLKKYGLYGKYKNILKNQEALDAAASQYDEFGKTVASKVLGVDINSVVKSVFSGGGFRTAATARELLNLPGIKNNPAAVNGIKKSFKDFYLKEIENSGVDILQNPIHSLDKATKVIRKHSSAMRELYRDNPKQLKAMYDYQKLLMMLSRNKNVSYAGGSTTVEKLTGSGTAKQILGNAVQLVAVSRGSGWFASSLRNLASAIFGAPSRLSGQKLEMILKEGIYNPEVAHTIMMGTKKGAPVAEVNKQLRRHLLAVGLYAKYEEE